VHIVQTDVRQSPVDFHCDVSSYLFLLLLLLLLLCFFVIIIIVVIVSVIVVIISISISISISSSDTLGAIWSPELSWPLRRPYTPLAT
jgi:hypothetical protein